MNLKKYYLQFDSQLKPLSCSKKFSLAGISLVHSRLHAEPHDELQLPSEQALHLYEPLILVIDNQRFLEHNYSLDVSRFGG